MNIQEATIEFKTWLEQQKAILPLSAPFWTIQASHPSNAQQVNTSPIILKQHGAAIMKTRPFFKPYSKLVLL